MDKDFCFRLLIGMRILRAKLDDNTMYHITMPDGTVVSADREIVDDWIRDLKQERMPGPHPAEWCLLAANELWKQRT